MAIGAGAPIIPPGPGGAPISGAALFWSWTRTAFGYIWRGIAAFAAILVVIAALRLVWVLGTSATDLAWNGPKNATRRLAAWSGLDKYIQVPANDPSPATAPATADPAYTTTPTVGGPPAELASVQHAQFGHSYQLQADELALRSQVEQVSADAAATREAGIRRLYSKNAQPGDCIVVGVLDKKTGLPLATDSDLYIETSQTTLTETVKSGLGKEFAALRGVSYKLYARIPGGKESTHVEIAYGINDSGSKPAILWIDN